MPGTNALAYSATKRKTVFSTLTPKDVVLAQDDPGPRLEDDRALDLAAVDEADGAVLKKNIELFFQN